MKRQSPGRGSRAGSAPTGLLSHTKDDVSVLNRFMQLAPQYYFSNLPPSESKDILQQVTGHLSPVSATKQEQHACETSPESPEQRCAVQ